LLSDKLFSKVSEHQITRAIVSAFGNLMEEYAECDVIIVGGGASGLMAGKRLAEKGSKSPNHRKE